jgi:hypothetical protein
MASKRLTIPRLPAAPPSLYLWAVSKRTMAIASLRIDSPKMIVYSFGSTLYRLKMANIVTGSVAESVAPTEMASTQVMVSPSKGILVHSHRMVPSETAEMKVPAKAKVRIVPIFLKKLACQQSACVPFSHHTLVSARLMLT